MTTHWDERAVCSGTMLELWFGPQDYDEPRDQTRWRQRRAAEICAGCPVRTECLAEELTRPIAEQHGFRAGMTARARERLLARWRDAGLIPALRPPESIDVVRALLLRGDDDTDLPETRDGGT
ncbi:WhiB family transcriptional regulator [Saccharopolyspora indica]|uniref:WhiB family transcriptional regulator n=1 Tax=Saccharopolyspora indica TaxID=1229659 RepID=UPI0022EAD6CC|nr:WhiB family transcriptional regulator [Saccharopolyspora indica]MDA3644391.1 WhiB family transcriptional regulator [Saccharopolyspora indica]